MKTNVFSFANEQGDIFWGKIITFFIIAVLVITVLGIGIKYLATGERWASLPAEKYNAKNVEKEYEWFYTMHSQIKANRKSIKDLGTKREDLKTLYGADTTKWSMTAQDEYKQIGQQINQVETALNNACGSYSARWNNVFHSMAAPGDIPQSCEAIK